MTDHALSDSCPIQKVKVIQIVPYDPNWPLVFEKEAALITHALGANGIAVHHVGSTAVPRLLAKPVIDIIAVVRSGDLSIAPLEKVGFSYSGEWNIPFKLGFTKRDQDHVNLHVFEEGHPEIALNIVFRDHLRANPDSRKDYAHIKETLLGDEASFQKPKGSMFSGYNLGKDRFIRSLLKTTVYKGHRFLKVTHGQEWEDYHRIRKTEIFDPMGVVYDPDHPSMTSSSAHHFILCHGMDARTVAHVELLNESDAVIQSIATDGPFQGQGYETEMMFLLEKWLKSLGVNSIHAESRQSSLGFYLKNGYTNMPFDIPENHESDSHDVPVGKVI
jgi:GrpB-like predicted nucleotidyltransferase (UPF0157 family)